MASNVIIDDYLSHKRSSLFFTEDNFKSVIDAWSQVDDLLVDLDNIEMFRGRHRWDQLDAYHFRILITNFLRRRDNDVPEADHYNDSLPIVRTLYFLLMGLIHCIQVKTGGTVDSMNLMRITDLEVTFKFTVSMIPEAKQPPKTPSGLRVIVDNTTE